MTARTECTSEPRPSVATRRPAWTSTHATRIPAGHASPCTEYPQTMPATSSPDGTHRSTLAEREEASRDSANAITSKACSSSLNAP